MVLRNRRERKLAETCMVSHRSFAAADQGSDFTFTFQNPEFLGSETKQLAQTQGSRRVWQRIESKPSFPAGVRWH